VLLGAHCGGRDVHDAVDVAIVKIQASAEARCGCRQLDLGAQAQTVSIKERSKNE
jgi:hypothetical protein